MRIDETLLDDPEAIEAGDAGGMLAAVGSAGSQVRKAVVDVSSSISTWVLSSAADRPRSVVVAGMGGSGIAGDVLSGVAGPGSAVPVVLHRGYGLPGWVGPPDLVFGVSASGRTEETLSAVEEARRRGTSLVTVGAPGSPLAALCSGSGGLHVPVNTAGWQPRACLWALSVPLLLAADVLALVDVPADVLDSTADLLDSLAERCHPAVESPTNPAKALALRLAGGIPVIWGSTPLAGVAATRFACQLNENAKLPAVSGALPEAGHNQVVVLDGPYAGVTAGETPRNIMRTGAASSRAPEIRLVVLRDTDEPPQLARRRAGCVELAEARGVGPSEIPAEGSHPLERLASLIAVADHASVYLALLLGIDPTPIRPIDYLKERTKERTKDHTALADAQPDEGGTRERT